MPIHLSRAFRLSTVLGRNGVEFIDENGGVLSVRFRKLRAHAQEPKKQR
jgi:hypothetical protein